MSDENASYVGNQAEPRAPNQDAIDSSTHVKDKHRQSLSSDGAEFSIDDQSDDESASSGDEVDDETAESDLKPYIFSSDGGGATERGNRTERLNSAGNMSSRQHREGSQMAQGGQSQRSRLTVIATDLSLNITHEPPSPKFHQQCPRSSSYRLKLFRNNSFLYSVRGLPQQVRVHQNAYIARWGPLELQFNSKQQLDIFALSIKHVELEWTPCGQHTARQTAATLQSSCPSAPLRSATPVEATAQAQPEPEPSKRSSFGSPLPLSDANGREALGQANRVSASKADSAVGHSFWKDNWVWVGMGVAIVAAVTYSVVKTDMPKEALEAVKAQEFKLHIVD